MSMFPPRRVLETSDELPFFDDEPPPPRNRAHVAALLFMGATIATGVIAFVALAFIVP